MIRAAIGFAYLFAFAATAEVRMEAMTSPEIAAALNSGATTVIVPTGGTEQNGPFLPVGKHNRIVEVNARAIAKMLGNTLVAPVIATVPEGGIEPPEGHMRFPGTVSLRKATFEAVLEDVARSYRAHGFRLICFLGDHGGSQSAQHHVAKRLSAEWREEGVLVLQVEAYYEAPGIAAFAKERGIDEPPSSHAGYFDGSQLFAASPYEVRPIRKLSSEEAHNLGVTGDASRASAADGRVLMRIRRDAAAAEIRRGLAVLAERRKRR